MDSRFSPRGAHLLPSCISVDILAYAGPRIGRVSKMREGLGDALMSRVMRVLRSLPYRGNIGRAFNVIAPKSYVRGYTRYLRSLGVRIEGAPKFVAGDAYFDGHDYSLIKLGDGVVISREVMILTHDYSIARALQAIGMAGWTGADTPHHEAAVTIGGNSFIGARASLLPGATIGTNCIIGACAVVKGNVPDNSIVVGNPARIIGDTLEWARRQADSDDYQRWR